jgi:hypothetical protein
MHGAILPDVTRVYAEIIEDLGTAFSWNMLLAQVTYKRNKPIHLEEVPLPVGVTGACFAFQDIDVIVVRKGLDPLRSLATRLHECAHLLLGHVRRLPVTYAEFLRNPDAKDALYRDRTTAYDLPHEADAETLATLLLECIERREQERRHMVITDFRIWSSS